MKALVALPEVVIEADGSRLDARAALALGEVRVQQKLNLPALCELVFRSPAGALSAGDSLRVGTALRVAVRGQRLPLFEGEVTALEMVYEPSAGQALHVRAYDRLHRLRKQAPVRAHVDVSLDDLARELAGAVGLAVQSEGSGPRWSYRIQHRQSDLDFLREQAEHAGRYFVLYQSTLHLFTLEGLSDAVPLSLGETLLEARFELNADAACDAVAAFGWDTEQVQRHAGHASIPRSGRTAIAAVSTWAIGADQTRTLADLRLESGEQADAAAQAELDRRAAREVILTGVAEGDARLRPGTPVDVAGVASVYGGRYVLTSVTHRIDQRFGFVSELSTAPPPPLPRARATLATLGVVTQIDDPDGLGRVRVSLPTFDDVTTSWVHVVSAGAGSGKGLVMLPDVGDEVLVLVSDDDLAQAVIVGGLYGGHGAPDTGIDGGSVKRYTLLTPGGQRVTLDDARGAIRLETRDGSFVEMTPERVHIHAAVDLEIEAPGKAIVVRGNTIDFQRG